MEEEQLQMNGRLIPTKYAMPGLRADDIIRDRLRQELDLALQYPLTLVCACAGSGKTTAVADWARSYALSTAWLTLEEHDNDSNRFWRYLVSALHTIDPAIGRNLSIAAPLNQHAENDSLETLISAIVRRGERLIVVLDNFQEIHSPVILRFLSEWIAHAPSFFHTVLISRIEPSLPLATYRAHHQLKQISFSELRFNLQETAQLYRAKLEQTLTMEEIHRIHVQTDGWATGLQLMALALENKISLHGNPYIQSYLLEEIIAKQSADMRKFMLTISILDRFCCDLCQAISGDDTDAASMLRLMLEHHLFITPLGGEQTWYQFHPLFTDVLRTRIESEFPSDEIIGLHRRAAAWFEQKSSIQEAIRHAIAGSELEHAARLLASHALTLLRNGDSTQLLHCIETVKPSAGNNFVPVSILQAKLFMLQGRYEEADAVFAGLEPGLAASADDDLAAALNDLASERAILRMIQAIDQGDIDSVMENMPLDTERHEYMSLFGEKDAQDVLLHRTQWGFRGKITTAERFFTEAAKLTDNYGPPTILTGYVYATLGEIYYEWNELDAALTCLTKGISEGLKYDNWMVRISCALALSRVRFAQGSRDGAIANLRAMKEELRNAGSNRWISVLTAAEIRMAIADGCQDAVQAWLSDLSSADGLEPIFSSEFERMTYVRALLSEGTVSRALELLEQIGWKADKEQRVGSLIEAAILQALCFAKQRKEGLALAALQRGVSLAMQERYVRLFVDEGAAMLELLLTLHGVAPKEIKDWIQNQLALFPKPTRNEDGGLTPQEMIVLQKIAAGMTNREISEQLSIAVGTVKAHTNKIYQKLGVKNRVQALQLAVSRFNQK